MNSINKNIFVLASVGIVLGMAQRGGAFEWRWGGAKTVEGYSIAQNFSEGLALVENQTAKRMAGYSTYGYIDKSGNVVFEGKFRYANPFSEGLAAVQTPEQYKCGYVDSKGKIAIACQFDEARDFSEGFAAVAIEGKCGYIDKTGKVVIAPQFDEAYPFFEGRAKITAKDRAGFIDTKGNIVVEPIYYNKTGFFSEGLAMVCDKGKCGYIDKDGKFVIKPQFDDGKEFREGLAPVKINNKWKYIDKNGVALPGDGFAEAEPFSEGLALVHVEVPVSTPGAYYPTGKMCGYIDHTGKCIIKSQFVRAQSFSNGLALAEIDSLWTEGQDCIFIDKTGKKVTKRFSLARSFKEGFALVKVTDERIAFINTKGQYVMEFKDYYALPDGGYSHNVPATAKHETGYGFINKKGAIVISPKYGKARSFSEGLASVETERRKGGYVDKSDKIVITQSGEDFSEGLAASKSGGLYGYIDKTGNYVIKPQFSNVEPFSEQKAAVKFTKTIIDNEWGYIDSNGNTIIPPQYSGAGPFHNGIAIVEYLKPTGEGLAKVTCHKYIDSSGQTVIDLDKSDFYMDYRGGFHINERLHEKYLRRKYLEPDAYDSFIGSLMPARGKKPPYKSGFVDKSGKFVIEPKFDDVKPFSDGLAPVRINYQWGYIDLTGKVVIEPAYDEAEPFSDNRALVTKNGKSGYIDPSGKVAIELQIFEEAYPFSSGLALIKMNGRYGYINESGEIAIEPKFCDADSFKEEVALVNMCE